MKRWIQTNLSKITLALALTGAISGVTGFIIGSIAHHKINDLTYFLNHDHTAVWGNTTIWQYNTGGDDKISLYFGSKQKSSNDTKWDGFYPDGYFDN